MDQRGGDDHTKNRESVSIMVVAPALQVSMDLIVATCVRIDELTQVVATWMQEKTNRRYIAHTMSRLVRKRTKSVCAGTMTIEELGINTNETFYLF